MSGKRPLEDRFWSKVEKGPDCWSWVGAHSPRGYGYGYGFIGNGPTQMLAHRVSWELHYGPIPPGMCVLHHCDNPPCVRPDHLFLGTQKDNVADMQAKGRYRGAGAIHRQKTHCPQGHPYDGKNLYLTPSGGRECRICRRQWMQDYHARVEVHV